MTATADDVAETGDAEEPSGTVLPPRLRNVAFALIAGGMLLAALDSTIVATALPTIVGDLGGAQHMSWVVTAYMLTQTIATVLAGKFGDIFGRKAIFLTSMVVFVGASALCGLAQNMAMLIGSRAIQGIGGGGLTVTAMAMIADIVPLRDRGKYQGAVGAVFGVTTVLGPLVGGLFTDHLSWRWVFYINVPVAIALFIPAIRLLPTGLRRSDRPVIDYWGILLISLGSGALILATSWGGTEFAWSSPVIIALFVGAVLGLILFCVAELRAAEPILPLRLFRTNVFSVSAVLSFIVGFALLGSMTFLPTYLQYCQGVSATESGLRTLPMVLGLLVASVTAGNTVSRTGRYKLFPISGAIVMAVGLWLLSRLDEHSSTWGTSGAMLVLGVGIGLAMQVLTIIVQNTADYRDLGVATSGVTFLRTLGSSFGAAIFGTIYANQLAPRLGRAIFASGADPSVVTTPDGVHGLPGPARAIVVRAYAESLQNTFQFAIPVAVLALVVALFLKQIPMRGIAQKHAADVGPGFGMPDQRSSEEQLEAQLVRLYSQLSLEDYERILKESGTDLDSVRAWIVRRVAMHQNRAGGAESAADPRNICAGPRLPVGLIEPALADTEQAGLIERRGDGYALSESGRDQFRTLVRDVLDWIGTQIEQEKGVPLTDADHESLRRIARRFLLQDDYEVVRTPLA